MSAVGLWVLCPHSTVWMRWHTDMAAATSVVNKLSQADNGRPSSLWLDVGLTAKCFTVTVRIAE